ncbi:MAG: DUF3775 domain-containing protein [Rhizomicrobium sp.]|nr:DUF3775 domain-containing protein [Rhizomicrobium sp.]
MPTLTITPDSAFAILLKAREFDVKVAESDPDSGSNPSDDGDVDALEFVPGDETQRELFSAIRDLNDDEMLDLLALIFVGRGDFTIQEWHAARQAAAEIERAKVPRFISDIPLVSDFLEEGLSQFDLTLTDYLDRH